MRGSQTTLPRSRFANSGPAADQIPRIFKIVSGKGGLVIWFVRNLEPREISLRPVKVFNTWEGD